MSPPDPDPSPDTIAADGTLLEAEDGELEPLMERVADDSASGDAFVEVADDTDLQARGSATLSFEVSRAGTYRIWARVRTPAAHRNSFFVRLDGGPDTEWRIPVPPDPVAWVWVPVPVDGDRDGRELAPGAHLLTFVNREDGTALDCVLVTGDLRSTPVGEGGALRPPF